MRLKIGSGFGIPIYLHWTFFLLPLWIIWTRPEDSPTSLPMVLTVAGLSFCCILLHEFGHILMARRFDIPTQDVTLYPIGGVARLLKMPARPLEEILIAIAGPAVNVAIATILFVIFAPIAILDFDWMERSFIGNVAFWLWITNILLVVFNMLPAFPMDGGRVLRASLSIWLGEYQATRIAVGLGIGMAGLFAVASFFGNAMLMVIAVFVVFAGQMELFAIRMRDRRQRQLQAEEPTTLEPPPLVNILPRKSVYVWDHRTGTWRQEPSPLT